MFRHESDRVAEKLQSRTAWRRSNRSSPSAESQSDSSRKDSDSPSTDEGNASETVDAIIPRPLSSAVEDQAASFFFANYIVPEYPFSEVHIPWMSRAYNAKRTDAVIPAIIQAVGLAGISNVFHSPDLMVRAYQDYGKALTMTNKALRDPVKAIEDMTLMAVWFLGIFETITLQGWDKLQSWYAHIDGACNLIDLRGKGQFNEPIGHLLFSQFRAQIKNTRVPEALLKWIPFAKSDSYHESPRDCLYIPTHAGIRLANLRADIADHSCTDDAEIVSAALEIDADLNASEAYLLLDWPFETLDAEMPSEDCFGGVYHVYKNACAAEMWNNYRSLRILTNEVILQFLEDRSAPGSLTMLGTALKDQYDNSKDLIRKMCVQICASVPTCLGALPRSAASTEPRLNPATSGLALLWPLFVACDTPDCDEGVRRWGLDKLQSIGATMGIRQAATMVTTLTSDFRPGEPFIGFRASSGERGHFGRQAEEAKSRP